MQTKTLDAILRLKSFLHVRNICCKELQITNEMLNRFNSHNMYPTQVPSDDESLAVMNLCSEIE